MKKILITAMTLVMTSVMANAQYFKTTNVGTARGWSYYTTDDKAYICDVDNDNNALILYNADMTLYKTIQVTGASVSSLVDLYSSTGDITVTQNLFNDDEHFEFVISETTGTETVYHVYNDEGTELGVLPSLLVIEVEDARYLCKSWDDENMVSHHELYKIEATTNGSKSLKISPALRVFPNPVNQGQPVRFEVGDGSISVDVYNSNGAETFRKVGEDVNAVELPTGNLSKGVYPYKVVDGEGQSHSGKIVVK